MTTGLSMENSITTKWLNDQWPNNQTTEQPSDQTTKRPNDQMNQQPNDQMNQQPNEQINQRPNDQTTKPRNYPTTKRSYNHTTKLVTSEPMEFFKKFYIYNILLEDIKRLDYTESV